MAQPNTGHWQARPKTEQILEVSCPKCGAKPHEWCDRAGDRLTPRGQALRKEGTPPSHEERMWSRQGHEPTKFPVLKAKQRPGRWDESKPRAGKSGRISPKHSTADATYPRRYTGDHLCPDCKKLVPVEVAVVSPQVIAYRCAGHGHKWLSDSHETFTRAS